jgi:hypothetical protein
MKGHITRASTIITAALLVAGGAVAPASASVHCDFSTLSAATDDATYTSKRATDDEAGLLAKVAAAKDKYDRHKVTDSIRKLTDYQSKVTALLGQGKLESGGTDLVALADEVIACVRGA